MDGYQIPTNSAQHHQQGVMFQPHTPSNEFGGTDAVYARPSNQQNVVGLPHNKASIATPVGSSFYQFPHARDLSSKLTESSTNQTKGNYSMVSMVIIHLLKIK